MKRKATVSGLSNSIEELRNFIIHCTTVQEWNEQRQYAKEFFTQDAINRLDASGFICQCVKS